MKAIELTNQEINDLIELFENIEKQECELDESFKNILKKLKKVLTNNY